VRAFQWERTRDRPLLRPCMCIFNTAKAPVNADMIKNQLGMCKHMKNCLIPCVISFIEDVFSLSLQFSEEENSSTSLCLSGVTTPHYIMHMFIISAFEALTLCARGARCVALPHSCGLFELTDRRACGARFSVSPSRLALVGASL
jgi:hypothetical protein